MKHTFEWRIATLVGCVRRLTVVVMRHQSHFLRSIACTPLLLSFAGCGSEAPQEIAERPDPFATSLSGEPVHETATAEGLAFLKPEIVLALQAANVATDVQFVFDSAYHFDDCNFTGASQVVADEQSVAVAALGPDGDPIESDIVALNAFARSLHVVQDFYSHSNWVELGATSLVDGSLTAWPLLSPYSSIDGSGILVVQGKPPAGTAVFRRKDEPYPENAIVHVRVKGKPGLGLMSGSVDYEPGDFCPTQIRMTHDELAKDSSSDAGRVAQHEQALALATEQTGHEWCRLLTLTRQAWGEAGDARLFAWVADESAASECGEPADLSSSATAPASALAGEPAAIGVEIANAGSTTSYGTRVSIEIAPGLSVTSVSSESAECSNVSPGAIECVVGELAGGGTGTIELVVVASEPGQYAVTSAISGHVPESNPENDQSTATLGVE